MDWLSIIIKVVSWVGIPIAQKLFPKIGKDVWDLVVSILNHINESDDQKKALEKVSKKVKECTGTACVAETKGLS